MTIDMELARQDDCLDRIVPSDLRLLVGERDALRAENERLRRENADIRVKWADYGRELESELAGLRQPVADEREAICDDALEDLASSACQMALANGVNEHAFLMLAKTVRDRCNSAALSAPAAGQDVSALVEALEKIAAGERLIEREGYSELENDMTIDYPGIAKEALAAHKAGGIHD